MYIFTLFIATIFPFFTLAQNLVPNPSFEEYKSDTCLIVTNRQIFSDRIEKWTMPTEGTSDIYGYVFGDEQCAIHPTSTFPFSIGSQSPRSGDLMAGIFTYGDFNYREYHQVELQQPLEQGQRYIAGMYVSLADSMPFAANNIGMLFSQTAINLDTNGIIEAFPNISNTKVINERNGWVLVSDTFRLAYDATHLLIGNFFSDETTAVQRVRDTVSYFRIRSSSYYFIDDVFVEPLPDDLFIPTVFTPNGDGKNDTFFIEKLASDSWSLNIYNRWGKRVYFAPSYNNNWDGGSLSPGIYFYELNHLRYSYSHRDWVSILKNQRWATLK
jgi:gliding motility-associated-like protein